MVHWFREHIIEPGRLPLFVCLLAHVITFLTTRTITRMIRLGRGPFRNNVTESGVHVHHAVPGVIVLIAGGFIAVAAGQQNAWAVVGGALVGIGSSLVLDEFALILRLDDVYWSEDGRISVQMVSLATAALGLMVLGLNPFQLSDEARADVALAVASIAVILVNLVFVLVLVTKGRYTVALIGAFVPLVAIVFAAQLADPRSRWARTRYGATKMERARERRCVHERRYGRYTRAVSNFVAGAPSPRDEPVSDAPLNGHETR